MDAVAVVGGTGFLGRHVVAALAAAGFEPRALSRRNGFDALAPDPEALRGCVAVVNLAGIKREQGRQTFEAVHVELPRRLAAAMKVAGIRRLVHVSVVAAREAPDLPYHHSKWRGEGAVRESGLDWTLLRPGVIYGEGDDLLSHLLLMIRAAPVFPVVNDGSAPMMPVDARDVARAVAAAVERPESVGREYAVVGPDRMTLRDVVARVAEAEGLPISIRGMPAGLMRIPVALMEATMRQPLSTRAQLAMLVEGLAGDPEPARRDLGVDPAPFAAERLRPLVEGTARHAPFTLRIFSAPRPAPETPASAAVVLAALAASFITLCFGAARDPWGATALASGLLLAGALGMGSVRRRLRPTPFRVGAGLAAGAALWGLTSSATALARAVWPAWDGYVGQLLAWRGAHGPAFLAGTLILIVAAEELLWRGVVTRFLMERTGRAGGIVLGAVLYAVAHLITLNPVLLAAALGLGLFWGWLYAATDDLVAPLICHLGWDVMVLFVAPPVSG